MKNAMSITPEEEKNAVVMLSTCSDCERRVKVEYYNDNFETYRTTFLGREGTESIHYCPYCGKKSPGFSPDDPDAPLRFDDVDIEADDDFGDDSVEESWWPDSEGVELESAAEEDEDEDYSFEMDDEKSIIMVCPSCKEKFRINPKGLKKHYCLYCGKAINQGVDL